MPNGIKFAGPAISEWKIWRQTLTITTSKTFKMHEIHLSSTSAIMFGINKCKMIHNTSRPAQSPQADEIIKILPNSGGKSMKLQLLTPYNLDSEHTPIETQTTSNNTLKLILHSSIQSQTARTQHRYNWLLIGWPLTRQKQNTLHYPRIPGDHLEDKQQLKLRMSAPRTHRQEKTSPASFFTRNARH